jgi:hypothetical protein
VADSHIAVPGSRGIQQSFPFPVRVPRPAPLEPKDQVYTKRWVLELLLDLAGYTSSANLVDAIAREPAAGEGASLALMIEQLVDSCQRLGRPISDCRKSLIAYELDEGSAERARTLAAEALARQGINASTAEDLVNSWASPRNETVASIRVLITELRRQPLRGIDAAPTGFRENRNSGLRGKHPVPNRLDALF